MSDNERVDRFVARHRAAMERVKAVDLDQLRADNREAVRRLKPKLEAERQAAAAAGDEKLAKALQKLVTELDRAVERLDDKANGE